MPTSSKIKIKQRELYLKDIWTEHYIDYMNICKLLLTLNLKIYGVRVGLKIHTLRNDENSKTIIEHLKGNRLIKNK